MRCISFDSYIKPQRKWVRLLTRSVVYLLIPTSNHNSSTISDSITDVVYLLIPTSNHNLHKIHGRAVCVVYLLIPTSNHNSGWLPLVISLLYIFWFLHQTTTGILVLSARKSCISFDSYIKPQLSAVIFDKKRVVYLLIPTSNHNISHRDAERRYVVYLLIPTSNHNCWSKYRSWWWVVYLLIPTSNHNTRICVKSITRLYIFWFLHQTTTAAMLHWLILRCISFDSYIKPQLQVQR